MKKVLLIIIIILVIILIKLYKNNKKCFSELSLIQYALLHYLKDFHEICRKHNLEYWAEGGTLLGAVRDKGIIPHDDDMDICMREDELLKLFSIIKDSKIYHITANDGLINTLDPKKRSIYKFKRKGIESAWIDIFLVVDEDDMINYKYENARKIWPNSWYYKKEVYPLKNVVFNDCFISIPNDPVSYLERNYGKDWKTPVVWNRH